MSKNFRGLGGKIAGMAVKGMIHDVEERMAAGEHVSAAPDSPEEAERLAHVKKKNRQGGTS